MPVTAEARRAGPGGDASAKSKSSAGAPGSASKASASSSKPSAKAAAGSSNKAMHGASKAAAAADAAGYVYDEIKWAAAYDVPEPSMEAIESDIVKTLAKERDERDKPSAELTLDIVVSCHLLDDAPLPRGPSPQRDQFLASLRNLRLDRLFLSAAPSHVLVSLPNITHVYLQHNRLTSIEDLASLPLLKFAAVSHNRLPEVTGLRGLAHLMFLDVSHNALQRLDPQQLPPSICFMKVEENPFLEGPAADGAVTALTAHLPRLKHLDGPVTLEARNRARRDLGLPPLAPEPRPEGMDSEDEEEEENEPEERAEAGPAGSAGRTDEEGGRGLLDAEHGGLVGIMDALDAVERSCMGKSEAHVRSSVRASTERFGIPASLATRASTSSLPSSATPAALPPPSPSLGPSPGAVAKGQQPPLAPGSPLPAPRQGSARGGGGGAPPPSPSPSMSPSSSLNVRAASPLRKPVLGPAGGAGSAAGLPSGGGGGAGAAAPLAPLKRNSSGGGGGGGGGSKMEAPMVSNAFRAADGPSGAGGSNKPGSAGTSGDTGGVRTSGSGSRSGPGQLQPLSRPGSGGRDALVGGPGVGTGAGAGPSSSNGLVSALEAAVEADLQLLRERMEGFLRAGADAAAAGAAGRAASGGSKGRAARPGSAGGGATSGAAPGAGAGVMQQGAMLDRMMGDAARRVGQQRQEAEAVSSSIRALRQSGGALAALQARAALSLVGPPGTPGGMGSSAAARQQHPRPAAEALLLRRSGEAAAASGPLDDLRAMTSRVAQITGSLVELAEGRPRSGAGGARAGSAEGAARGTTRSSLEGVKEDQEEEEEEGPAKAAAAGAAAGRGPADPPPCPRGLDDLESDSEDDADIDGAVIPGFKSSLPPNPFA